MLGGGFLLNYPATDVANDGDVGLHFSPSFDLCPPHRCGRNLRQPHGDTRLADTVRTQTLLDGDKIVKWRVADTKIVEKIHPFWVFLYQIAEGLKSFFYMIDVPGPVLG